MRKKRAGMQGARGSLRSVSSYCGRRTWYTTRRTQGAQRPLRQVPPVTLRALRAATGVTCAATAVRGDTSHGAVDSLHARSLLKRALPRSSQAPPNMFIRELHIPVGCHRVI